MSLIDTNRKILSQRLQPGSKGILYAEDGAAEMLLVSAGPSLIEGKANRNVSRAYLFSSLYRFCKAVLVVLCRTHSHSLSQKQISFSASFDVCCHAYE